MFTGWDRPSHWLVLVVVVVVLFGYKKLPDAARSVGRSLRIFKTEIKGMAEDDRIRDNAQADDAARGQAHEVTKAVTIPTSQQVNAEGASHPRPKPTSR